RPEDGAVGEHDLDGADVVDGQPVRAAEETDASGGGETADTDAPVVAGADRPPVGVQGSGHLAPPGTGTEADEPPLLVEHLDAVHPGQVDDDSTVVGGAAADAVPAAAQGERDVVLPRERERLDDLLRAARSQDETR